MRLEGTLDLEPRRVQRWVPVVAIVVPVFLCVAMATWFIRAFIAPPMVAIPAYTTIAVITPPDREAPLPDSSQPPPRPAQTERPAVSATVAAFNEPTPPVTLPMFATFALAPPSASLRTAPPATVEPEPNAAPSPAQADNPDPVPSASAGPPPQTHAAAAQDAPDSIATAALEPSEPLAGPIPLPPLRRRLSAVQADGQVPLPRIRPAVETPAVEADGERRMFNAHAPD